MNQNEQIDDPDYDRILEMQDFFPKIFLLPSEIRLDKQEGIKVIKRNPHQPDKFEEQSVKSILVEEKQIRKFTDNPENDQYGKVQHPAGHGLLSLFKRTSDRRIKLAICICVYSQPKHMLKATIKGIQESNRDFLNKAGIMSHEIIIIVVFDGIDHLNSSSDQTENMISFFNQVDLKNGFRHRPHGKPLDQFLKQLEENKYDTNLLNQDKMGNINLFTEEQLSQLQPTLFQNQYNQYTKTRQLLADIEKIKNIKDLRIDHLPFEVVKKYEELCVNFCAENNLWFETQDEIQQYLTSSRKNMKFKLMYEALSDTQNLCKQYMESRQDKTILYPVRLEKDYLKNPREFHFEEERSSLIDESQRKQFNYMFFCVKHKNTGKLNSHMLFFQGFCKLFDPQYCILTDVGVKPQNDAIYKMWEHMELNPKCGGVCGYMSLKIQNPSDDLGYRQDGYNQNDVDCITRFVNYFVSIQRAQQFEYHYAHMLDKPFQACFDYIHVLPGAFSGYRWKALKSVAYKETSKENNENKNFEGETERYTVSSSSEDEEEEAETLMKRYLKTALSERIDLSLEDSNMYLAEDRILCLGIHTLGYDLHYLPDAESYVDPVTSLTKLLGQRRRWINGSWFAFNYVREHSYESSSIIFLIQLLYYSFLQKLSWIANGLFYVAMNMTLISFVTDNVVPSVQQFFLRANNYDLSRYKIGIFNLQNVIQSIPDIINFIYILAIFSIILFSVLVNNNNPKFKTIYYGASTLFGFYGILVLSLLIYNTINIISSIQTGGTTSPDDTDYIIPLIYLRVLILFVIVGFAIPILWTMSFRKSIEMLTSLISYIFYTPTYINILQIFAFCRIDDLSWGTKGLDKEETAVLSREWEKRKYIFVLQYVISNVALAYLLISLKKYDYPKNIIILSFAALTVFLLIFRLVFALIYLVKYYVTRPFKKFQSDYINQNRATGYRIYNALKIIELKIKEGEKERTKKKKEEEFRNVAKATSLILSQTLSNFGKKIRNKVANHIINNNMIPRKDLLDPKKKFKNRRKAALAKKKQLSNEIIQEVQEENDSQSKQKSKEVSKQDIPSNYFIPESQIKSTGKSGIKSILEKIKEKHRKRKNNDN